MSLGQLIVTTACVQCPQSSEWDIESPGTGVLDSCEPSPGCWDLSSILSDAPILQALPPWFPSLLASTITLSKYTGLTTAGNSSKPSSPSPKSLEEHVKSTGSFEGRRYSLLKLLCHSFSSSSSEEKTRLFVCFVFTITCAWNALLSAFTRRTELVLQRNYLLQEALLLSACHDYPCLFSEHCLKARPFSRGLFS